MIERCLRCGTSMNKKKGIAHQPYWDCGSCGNQFSYSRGWSMFNGGHPSNKPW